MRAASKHADSAPIRRGTRHGRSLGSFDSASVGLMGPVRYSFQARDFRCCAGFWTPAITKDPRAQLAGVQKAPRHEVAGSWAPAVQRALWGFDGGAELEGKRDASTRRRATSAYRGTEDSGVASRRACEVQQRTASELIDGYCFQRRQPGRTLPQLPRFGMSVAQEYF